MGMEVVAWGSGQVHRGCDVTLVFILVILPPTNAYSWPCPYFDPRT